MSNTKALFTDLDGTFLTDDKQITSENREAMNQLLSKGHKAIITTGRPLPSAVIQAQKLGLTEEGCYLIAYNGGVLYDTYHETVLFEKLLPKEYVLQIADEANRRKIHIQAYDRERVLVEPRCDNDIVRFYCGRIDMEFGVIDSFSSLKETPAKLLLIDRHNKAVLEDMQGWIRNHFDEVIDCFFSCDEFLEIMSKHLNKGNGLRMMADHLGIDIKDTIAAGDAENDLSMIRAAGIGCAMINGSKIVKDSADYITQADNNHGGVAEVIRKFILES